MVPLHASDGAMAGAFQAPREQRMISTRSKADPGPVRQGQTSPPSSRYLLRDRALRLLGLVVSRS
jgi:hypothetical protein